MITIDDLMEICVSSDETELIIADHDTAELLWKGNWLDLPEEYLAQGIESFDIPEEHMIYCTVTMLTNNYTI